MDDRPHLILDYDDRRGASAVRSSLSVVSLWVAILSLPSCLSMSDSWFRMGERAWPVAFGMPVAAMVLGVVSVVRVSNSGGRLRGAGMSVAAISIGAVGLMGSGLIHAIFHWC